MTRVEHKSALTGGRDDWGTPKPFLEQIEKHYGKITIDLAASYDNKVCEQFVSEKDDFLVFDTSHIKGLGFLNPPYSKCQSFIRRAYTTAREDFPIVCLVPARTDTAWFHEAAHFAVEIGFLKGRLKFVGAEAGAPFPSLTLLFGGKGVIGFFNIGGHPNFFPWHLTPKERGF